MRVLIGGITKIVARSYHGTNHRFCEPCYKDGIITDATATVSRYWNNPDEVYTSFTCDPHTDEYMSGDAIPKEDQRNPDPA